MKIEIADLSGYCFGVKRALSMAEDTLKNEPRKVFTLGQIIHNPIVVEELDRKGIHSVSSIQQIPEGSLVVIRSHGLPPSAVKKLNEKGISTVDATCPFVKTAQRKAKDLSNQGYFVVLVGARDHPEVIGIKEQVESDKIIVAQTTDDLAQIPCNRKKIGVMVQTTQTLEKLKEMVDSLLDFAQQLKVINTICNTTKRRQQEARKLAAGVDLMLIVGGKNSANTSHLADIAREVNPNTKHIQSYREIDKKWLSGVKKVGLSGGASTPHDHILEVKKFLGAY